MLFINYKGDTPQQRFYSLGVKGNNKANKIKFVVARHQADIDLSGYVCNLKVQNKEHDWLDLIMLDGVVNTTTDTIEYEWLMTAKSTQFRNLELQLEFISTDNEESVVFQTLICELELNETIKVGDEQPDDKELSALKQVEQKVQDLNNEIIDLQERNIWKEVEIGYDEQHDETHFIFPKNVIPLMFEIANKDLQIYFDYERYELLDKKGIVKTDFKRSFQFDDSYLVYICIKGKYDDIDFENDGVDLKYILRDCTRDWSGINFNSFEVIGSNRNNIAWCLEVLKRNDENRILKAVLPKGYLPIGYTDGNDDICYFNYDENVIIDVDGNQIARIYLDDYEQLVLDYEALGGSEEAINSIAFVKGSMYGLRGVNFDPKSSGYSKYVPYFEPTDHLNKVVEYFDTHRNIFFGGFMPAIIGEGNSTWGYICSFSIADHNISMRAMPFGVEGDYTAIKRNEANILEYNPTLEQFIDESEEMYELVDDKRDFDINGTKTFYDPIGVGSTFKIKNDGFLTIDWKNVSHFSFQVNNTTADFFPQVNTKSNCLGTKNKRWRSIYLQNNLNFLNYSFADQNGSLILYRMDDDGVHSHSFVDFNRSYQRVYIEGDLHLDKTHEARFGDKYYLQKSSSEFYCGYGSGNQKKVVWSINDANKFQIYDDFYLQDGSGDIVWVIKHNTNDKSLNFFDNYYGNKNILKIASTGIEVDGSIKIGSADEISLNGVNLQITADKILLLNSKSHIIRTINDNRDDLGANGFRFRDLYLSRNFSDGTNSYTIAESMAQFNPTDTGTTEIKWSKMLTFSLSANTTFTLETAKAGCLNEYKAIITNSGASTITLTMPSGVKIICNDDNCVISSNTITLPSGVSLEVSIVDNKMCAVNFEA